MRVPEVLHRELRRSGCEARTGGEGPGCRSSPRTRAKGRCPRIPEKKFAFVSLFLFLIHKLDINIFKSTALQIKHCVTHLKVVPSLIPTFKKERKEKLPLLKILNSLKMVLQLQAA